MDSWLHYSEFDYNLFNPDTQKDIRLAKFLNNIGRIYSCVGIYRRIFQNQINAVLSDRFIPGDYRFSSIVLI